MDYFNDNILGLEHGSYVSCCVAVYAGSESSRILSKILICVPKMNVGLMGLERHEGEQSMTSVSFLGELSL